MFNEAVAQIKDKEYYAIAYNKDVVALAIVALNSKLRIKKNKESNNRAQIVYLKEVEID